jgi:glutamate synthase domain-containing protein 2
MIHRIRGFVIPGLALLLAALLAAAPFYPAARWGAGVCALVLALGVHDLLQKKHSILRNYPVLAHFRFLLEGIRPEMQQYFIERDTDGKPYDRDSRTLVYERAKDLHAEMPFGTQLDVYAPGYEFFNHSIAPRPKQEEQFRVRVGGPDCTQPYDMSLLNVSAMSFGALSAHAIHALSAGAKLGGFAHDTGEGGLSQYHEQGGGDLVWEIGTAYFGTRTADGAFDPVQFADKANLDQVKCVSIKLSQGAKPGLGGVMPAAKVTPEIAEIRGVPVGVKCISPPHHTAFSTPRGLIEFVAELREMANGKPTGFKLCIGHPTDFIGICKAMVEMEVYPDFIIIDGGEGGTGAAPLEFEDHVGMPLREGLIFAHNALVGFGVRDKIRVGASGKVASAFDIARALALGADYTNAARAMMFAVGCIQAQRCQTNTCPVGVATQDTRRQRALDVPTKAERVHHFHRETISGFNLYLASMGLTDPSQIHPSMLGHRADQTTLLTYAQMYNWLQPGELLNDPPPPWDIVVDGASAEDFNPVGGIDWPDTGRNLLQT